MSAAARLARRVVAAQSSAEEAAAGEVDEQQRVTWGSLGCPSEIGLYRTGDSRLNMQVRVKKIHIIVAENDPSALFTVVTFRPPLGPAEFMLGHRVA